MNRFLPLLTLLLPCLLPAQQHRVFTPIAGFYLSAGACFYVAPLRFEPASPDLYDRPFYRALPAAGLTIVQTNGLTWAIHYTEFNRWASENTNGPNSPRDISIVQTGALLVGLQHRLADRPWLRFGGQIGPFYGTDQTFVDPYVDQSFFSNSLRSRNIVRSQVAGVQVRGALDVLFGRGYGFSFGMSNWIYNGRMVVRPEAKFAFGRLSKRKKPR